MFNDQFGVVGTLGAGYAHTSESISSGSSGTVEVKGNGFYTGLTPSVVFFPIPKFAIGASIGGLNYQRLGRKAEDATGDAKNHVSNFGASFGLDQLQFSGTYYFGR
jgi:hypothetical protein